MSSLAETVRIYEAKLAERDAEITRLRADVERLRDELNQAVAELVEAANVLRPSYSGMASLMTTAAQRHRNALAATEPKP